MNKTFDLIEIAIAMVIIGLAGCIIAGQARAGKYQGDFHIAPHAEKVIKQEGMVLWRIIDGPVRCYVVITDARMIGMQSSLSCVIPEKKVKDEDPARD